MTSSSFQEVGRLDREALRALLVSGDPQERIWAAWTLALKLGGEAAPDLDRAVRASPAAGTRRHLVVTLAGLGERAVLFAIAEADPHALVRATACRYLIRTQPAADPETAAFILDRLRTDPAASVKETILHDAGDALPSITLEQLAGLVADPAAEVRRLAFDVLKRRYGIGQAAASAVSGRLWQEPGRALLADLAAFCLDGGALEEVVRAALDGEPPVRLLLLQVMRVQGISVPWPQAEGLAALGEIAVDLELLDLLDREALRDGFDWLAQTLATRIPRPYRQPEHTYFYAALTPFAAVIDALTGARLPQRSRRDLSAIADFLRQEIAELCAMDPEEWEDLEGEPVADEIARYEEITGKIEKWLEQA